MGSKPSDDRAAERKRTERERSREQGWRYVSVRVPPGSADAIKRAAAMHREEYLREDV